MNDAMFHPVCTLYTTMLTHTEPICIVVLVLAKSRTRIETRYDKRRNCRQQSGFFIVAEFQHVQLKTGWKGYIRVGRFPFVPVVSTFPACHQSSLRPWVIGSRNKGSLPIMALYRLAVLTGNSTRLSDNSVKKYQLLTASSDAIARAHADRNNAVITGWRVVR